MISFTWQNQGNIGDHETNRAMIGHSLTGDALGGTCGDAFGVGGWTSRYGSTAVDWSSYFSYQFKSLTTMVDVTIITDKFMSAVLTTGLGTVKDCTLRRYFDGGFLPLISVQVTKAGSIQCQANIVTGTSTFTETISANFNDTVLFANITFPPFSESGVSMRASCDGVTVVQCGYEEVLSGWQAGSNNGNNKTTPPSFKVPTSRPDSDGDTCSFLCKAGLPTINLPNLSALFAEAMQLLLYLAFGVGIFYGVKYLNNKKKNNAGEGHSSMGNLASLAVPELKVMQMLNR